MDDNVNERASGRAEKNADFEIEQLRKQLQDSRRDVTLAALRYRELENKLLEVAANPAPYWLKSRLQSFRIDTFILGFVRKIFKIRAIRSFAHRVVPASVKTALIHRMSGMKNDSVDGKITLSSFFTKSFIRPKIDWLVPGYEQYEFVLICNSYPRQGKEYGGSFVQSRVEAYVKGGCKVLVVEVNDRNKNISFGAAGSTGCLRMRVGDLAVYFKAICKHNPKILTHSPTPNTLSVLAQSAAPDRCFHWFHGFEVRDYRRLFFNFLTPEIEFQRRVRDEVNQMRKEAAAPVFAQKKTAKIVVSNYLKSIAEKDIGQAIENGHVIPNFINCDHYAFEEKMPEQAVKILLIRSFQSRNYANDIAIDAIKILSKRAGFDELKFTICGTGALFRPLVNEISHLLNVEIREGHLSAIQMQQMHAQNGIFLAPSRFDTQGVLMGEAMASGLVCVTNRVSAIPEYADSDCAVLVRADDPLAYADAIWNLYKNPQLLPVLSKAAGKRVREQCGYDNTIKRELELIGSGS